jgi:hypothetical protein
MCGAPGMACCAGEVCQAGGVCAGATDSMPGMCNPCGGANQTCCPPASGNGAGTCTSATNRCVNGTGMMEDMCRPCGAMGQPCCGTNANPTCTGTLTCVTPTAGGSAVCGAL